MLRHLALAMFLLPLRVASHALVTNASNVRLECLSMPEFVERDDMSSLLQSGVLHIHANVRSSFGAHESSPGAPYEAHSKELNPIYDMYADLILASLLLAFLFMVHWVRLDDAGPPLGSPIAANPGERAGLLDNAKFLCVSLVIFHHTCLPFEHNNFGLSRQLLKPDWSKLLFHIACPLHVRTLCFISGILSRNKLQAEKVMVNLIGPLLGFCFMIQPLLLLMGRQFFGAPPSQYENPLQSLFHSGGQLQWYLVALIWWRALGSLIRPFSPFVRILAAYMVAAMMLHVSTDFLSLPAIDQFPIFVAGQLFPYDQMLKKLPWRPITAMMGLLMILAISSVCAFVDESHMVLADNFFPITFQNDIVNLSSMPLFWLRGLASISLELWKCIVFLFLVCPRQTTSFTDAGKHSLYPYLLHGGVIPWLGKAAVLTPFLKDRIAIALPFKVIVVVVDFLICVGVCAFLASKPVRCVFSLILEPTWIRNFYVKDRQDNMTPAASNAEQEQSKNIER